MKLCRMASLTKALSLVEVLIVILLISSSLLLAIRLFPAIFMLNKKTDDIITAKNLTEELIQNLKSEVNTKKLGVYTGTLTVTTSNLTYRDNILPVHAIVNPYKCFWQLVRLTESNVYSPEPAGLDTFIASSNTTADTKYQQRNPSKYEPVSSTSDDDWVVTKQFWLDWRKKIETQLPPGSFTNSQRASAIVTASYVYIDPNSIFKTAMSDFSNFTQLSQVINNGSTTPGAPSITASKYMVQVSVSMYWRDRLFKGTYSRNTAKPNYKLSTLIMPDLNSTSLSQ